MRKKTIWFVLAAEIMFLCIAGCGGGGMKGDNKVYFEDAPVVHEYTSLAVIEYGMTSVMIEGPDYNGKPTRFFAYIGFPAAADANNRVPGVVLMHGGGGTAFAAWVREWNNRGYAAIAVDMEGQLPVGQFPDRERHDYSGPARSGIFDDITTTTEKNTWWYHAVDIGIRALKVLGNDVKVDEGRVGIVGISWGGIITSMIIGRESRFAFGVMIYGCGFLYESENQYQQAVESWTPDIQKYYREFVDGAAGFKKATMPVLFLNSDSDSHFSPAIQTKSFLACPDATISIKPELAHSHEDGWRAKESYAFADSITKDGNRLIRLQAGDVQDGKVVLSIDKNSRQMADVYIMYSTADAKTAWMSNDYTEQSMISENQSQIEVTLPQGVKTYYFVATDSENNQSSTQMFTI